MKIAFYTPSIDVRGTCVAIYDYAHHNETLLGNKSVILVPTPARTAEGTAIWSKFSDRFEIRSFDSPEEMEDVISDMDVLYTIKYGKNDGVFSKRVKTLIHCVFDMTEPHGTVFAAVSETLARKFGKKEYVPHMVSLKPSNQKNYRELLGIPKDAVVFGRHGGQDTFNLGWAHRAIFRALEQRENIHIVLVNTPAYIKHHRVHYLSQIVSEEEKNAFISTCDAHLECGSLGHTFGLSIAEFSVNNKPIIAYGGEVWNRAHLDILGSNAFLYKDEESLFKILVDFNKLDVEGRDWNCYRDYSPENVMDQFKRVFLD